MRTKRYLLCMAAVLTSMSAASVLAHHSAAQFDFAQTVTVEGVIKEVSVANPHIRLVLDVDDEKGRRDIEFEGHSRNNVYRRGWRPDMLNVGDTLAIEIAPMRSGEDGGYVKDFVLKDGTRF